MYHKLPSQLSHPRSISLMEPTLLFRPWHTHPRLFRQCRRGTIKHGPGIRPLALRRYGEGTNGPSELVDSPNVQTCVSSFHYSIPRLIPQLASHSHLSQPLFLDPIVGNAHTWRRMTSCSRWRGSRPCARQVEVSGRGGSSPPRGRQERQRG